MTDRTATGSGSSGLSRVWVVLVCLIVASWSARTIANLSFERDGETWFLLQDDAMISMAYARNLAEGRGLRWSSALPPAEGFTHPLWLAPMLLSQHLGLPIPTRAAVVQVVAALLLAAIPLFLAPLVRRIPVLARSDLASGVAVATGSWCAALGLWSLLGMETAALAVVLLGAAGHTVARLSDRRELGIGFYLLAGAGFWLRMDLLIPLGAIWLVHRLEIRKAPRAGPVGVDRAGLLVLGLSILALFSARWALFGEWLPNTYFLKLTGIPLPARVLRGLVVTSERLIKDAPFWLFALAGAWMGRRDPKVRALGAPVLAVLHYSVWVGGDVWDRWEPIGANRFVAPAVPLAAVLAALPVAEALRQFAGRRLLRASVGFAAGALVILGLNGLVSGAESAERLALLFAARPPHFKAVHQDVLDRLERLDAFVSPGDRVATVWAGWPAYLRPDLEWIDVLGYNDLVVAREPCVEQFSVRRWRWFTPGHCKWDYVRSVEVLRADAFFQLWTGPSGRESVPRYLAEHGYREVEDFWLHEDDRPADGHRLPTR